MKLTTCRSCGAEIEWIVMERTGKKMPINRKLEVVVVKNGDGTGRCVSGYLSHFATCPHAGEHRKDE